MKFSYTALTTDNKKISGVLEAENLQAGEAELHKMGVAIISFEEITEDQYEKLNKEQEISKETSGVKTFTFLAIDPNKQEVEGTIDAIDDYTAFKRLKTEYQFTVKNLYPSNATDAEKQAALGVLEGFEARAEEDRESAGETEKGGKSEAENEGEEKMNEEVIKEIDAVIINTKKVLGEHSDLFSNDMIREIENTLGSLERVRTSNNIKHITEISNDLYELVRNPDQTEGKASTETYKQIIGEMEDSALVKKEFDLYSKAVDASGAKKLFGRIAGKLKGMTESKEEEIGKKPSAFSRLKAKVHNILVKSTSRRKPKKEKKVSKLSRVATSFKNFISAKSPTIRKAHQKEFMRALKGLFGKSASKDEAADEETAPDADAERTLAAKTVESPKSGKEKGDKKGVLRPAKKIKPEKEGKWDFTGFFVEADSFIGWLLSFYIIYYFLVNISLEKNIGLSRELVFKTLGTPLILNITILLLFLHFILRLRNLHFRHHILASLFLFFLGIGAYALVIINF